MRIDLRETENYDHTEKIAGEKSEDNVEFYFRGNRSFLFNFGRDLAILTEGSDNDAVVRELDFREMLKHLVSVMVGWEGLIDSNTNSRILFSKDMAYKVLDNFDVIPQKRIIKILMIVWSAVQLRETTLKNLSDGSMNLVDPSLDGSKSASCIVTTPLTDVKSVKKRRVKK